MEETTTRLPAEWEKQSAIIIAWPHQDTDWHYMLDEVESCYVKVAEAITLHEDLVIVTPDPGYLSKKLAHLPIDRLHIYGVSTNDTWARDFGPISVVKNGVPVLYDFKFNAWGLKFAANYDNLINSSLQQQGAFKVPVENHLNFVLEGGSIESDGKGTLLTTAECLLSKNRNGEFSKQQIEEYMSQHFGINHFIWLNHGFLEGDDTDSHIDTLARFCPDDVIAYVACDDPHDPHYDALKQMEAELIAAANADPQRHIKLVKLPFPAAIHDEDGLRLPATYANFLITNRQVLVPTYGQEETDNKALNIIGTIFPGREIIGIDCRALIKQHGSLHCITMQLIEGSF